MFDAIQHDGPREPDYTELDCGHGRIIRRSIWVTSADGTDFRMPTGSRGFAATATTSTAP